MLLSSHENPWNKRRGGLHNFQTAIVDTAGKKEKVSSTNCFSLIFTKRTIVLELIVPVMMTKRMLALILRLTRTTQELILSGGFGKLTSW